MRPSDVHQSAPSFKPTTLTQGTKRMMVQGELGTPVSSEDHGSKVVDMYKYTDGGEKNNGASKTGRILLYTGGDLFTCWLDQIIWMPAEEFGFDGTDHVVTVDYSKSSEGSYLINKVEDRTLAGRSKVKESF